MNAIQIRICSYRAAQRYIVRRMLQSILPAFQQRWPGWEIEVVETRDPQEILRYTPVLVHTSILINGLLVCAGRTPAKMELLAWLDEAAGLIQTCKERD